MAGFEGADHVNAAGLALDMVATSGHAADIDADFARLKSHGLATVRESIGWRLAEPDGGERYDFGRALHIAKAARRHGIQVVWSLMHYGTPPGTGLLDDALPERFAAFAAAAARAVAPYAVGTPVFNPINEISFLAWAACESNLIHPHVGDRDDPRYTGMPDGFVVKRRLVRAELAAMAAIRAVVPRARFLHVDPLVHVVPPADADADLADEARRFRDFQWQSWDMLCGRLEPELGGHPDALDIIGVNHYSTAQWEFGTGQTLPWPPVEGSGTRRLPFATLLAECWQRYRRPIIVAETGHTDGERDIWLDDIGAGAQQALAAGVPLLGVCLYPIIGRPDWNDASDWHSCGLWDAALPYAAAPAGRPERHLHAPLAGALARWRRLVPAPFTQQQRHATMNDLIVFSHLRWDFVFQRPQHLLTRLAQHWRVIVVEEPVHDPHGPARLDVQHTAQGIEVLRPHTPLASHGFADDQMAAIAQPLARALAQRGVSAPTVWFYTPMALPLLDKLEARAVVYDCMDELSAFRGAPLAMREREARLLRRADLVLTGGPSLYEAKRTLAANVLCVPSSVDARHFAARPHAVDDALTQRALALQGPIGKPRLGYFGVIDERMDLDLVAAIADADPGWQVIMVGPVVKIDPGTLPRRANLHWLGQQGYELLPRLIETWRVCLMPFALNESTRFISPTKTLEYLAAGKAVVSTDIHDVGVLYGDAVAIAADAPAFVAACRAALDETDAQRLQRQQRATATVARYSWDQTAETVHQALLAVAAPQQAMGRGAGHGTAAANTALQRAANDT